MDAKKFIIHIIATEFQRKIMVPFFKSNDNMSLCEASQLFGKLKNRFRTPPSSLHRNKIVKIQTEVHLC